eukprot:31506-Pelagococcus_subviridis.AAC.11
MASSADVATPYEQPHHYSKRAPSAAPSAATRARAAVAARVERDNAHVARRLAELREEGPSSFHAPDGAASLKTTTTTTTARRRARRAAASSSSAASTRTSSSRAHDRGVDKDATARNSYPSTRSWPPRRAPAFDGRLRAERLRVREGNRALREMLVNQHKASRDSQLVREGKGRPVDGLSMWRKRMQLYDDRPPNLAGTVDEDGKCVATGVPKAMAVARCSATGLYTYFGADGHKLREHRECPGLFYWCASSAERSHSASGRYTFHPPSISSVSFKVDRGTVQLTDTSPIKTHAATSGSTSSPRSTASRNASSWTTTPVARRRGTPRGRRRSPGS